MSASMGTRVVRFVGAVLVCLTAGGAGPWAQSAAAPMSPNELHRARRMLREGYEVVKKTYHDPTFRGLDLDTRFTEYDEQLRVAPTMSAGLAVIAGFLEGLKDSHTFFQPPAWAYTVEYGYRLAVVGDDVFVQHVIPRTDAASNVKVGDQLLSLNGGAVGRDTFARMQYVFQVLQPQTVTVLELRDPAGVERTVSVETRVTPGRQVRNLVGPGAGLELQELRREAEAESRLARQRYVEQGDVLIWKMPSFFVEDTEIDRMFSIARKHGTLILDLRGNPGGLVDALRRMVGHLFPHDVTIAERVTRKGRTRLTARSRGRAAFGGKLIVLLDAASGSSAELFARVVQLEARGVVIGDRSAGAVMESRMYPFVQGDAITVVYAFWVTDADLVPKDGRSLEGVGVTPDEELRPTGADLFAGQDPVMARAAAIAGLDLDAVAAGRLFPFEWKSPAQPGAR